MNTPLHIAIQNGNIEIIKTLLADGCDLSARNADGLTPLDLATMLNNEEVVRLLLERGAGHLPTPPETVVLDVPQRKKRITFLLILCLVVVGLGTFFGIVHALIDNAIWLNNHPRDAKRISAVVNTAYCLLLVLPGLVVSLLCYFFFLFRLWEEVPRRFARTTPGIAAGLSLIPVFSWYWMFIALGGLYQDMNKTLESYGHNKRFNTTMIIVACVLWLASDLFALLIGFVFGIVREVSCDPQTLVVLFNIFFILFTLLWFIFTAVMYWIIRKNVLEFMDIKSSVGK